MRFILAVLLSVQAHSSLRDHWEVLRKLGLGTTCYLHLVNYHSRDARHLFFARQTTSQQRLELIESLSRRGQQLLLDDLVRAAGNTNSVRFALEWIPELVTRVSPVRDHFDRGLRALVANLFRNLLGHTQDEALRINILEAIQRIAENLKDDEWLLKSLVAGLPSYSIGADPGMSQAVLLKTIETVKIIGLMSAKAAETDSPDGRGHYITAGFAGEYLQVNVMNNPRFSLEDRLVAIDGYRQIEEAMRASPAAEFFTDFPALIEQVIKVFDAKPSG